MGYYAPWCGYCQKIEPIYIELAESMTSKDLVFGKMDVTVNDLIGMQVSSYPTLVLHKNGEKVFYEGERELEEMKVWLQE
jgi:thiol-disulfide isomerase/thioredoxin